MAPLHIMAPHSFPLASSTSRSRWRRKIHFHKNFRFFLSTPFWRQEDRSSKAPIRASASSLHWLYFEGFNWKVSLAWTDLGLSSRIFMCLGSLKFCLSYGRILNCMTTSGSLLRSLCLSDHRITDSLRLEKTSKSNRQPNTTMPAKPCPEVPYLHIFWTPPGMVTPPLPWAACSNAYPLLQ